MIRPILAALALMPQVAMAEIVIPASPTEPAMQSANLTFDAWLEGFRSRARAEGLTDGTLSALDDDSEQVAELASLAKARLNDTYNLVSSEGIQMHGGIGMTDEYEIGFFMKRSRVCEHTLGGSAFHRDRYGVLQGY